MSRSRKDIEIDMTHAQSDLASAIYDARCNPSASVYRTKVADCQQRYVSLREELNTFDAGNTPLTTTDAEPTRSHQ